MKLTAILINALMLAEVHAFLAPTKGRFAKVEVAASDDLFEDLQTAAADRRTFLWTSIGASFAAVTAFPRGATAEDGVDYKAVSADIASMIKANPDWGPTMVRIAWHTSGTYDKNLKTGGSQGGTMRFKSELDHGGNAGLEATAAKWLEPLIEKYPGLSHGDLYTLSGVVAIKTLGGPTIGWKSGRIDTPEDTVTPDDRLPAADSGPSGADKADSDHLRTVFYRMGFDDREIVALSGAHALGRCHTTASGYDGPWTPTPTTFNNAYFTLLSNLKWVPKEWNGPYQYVDAPTGKLMMLPSDLVLLEDKKFRKWVGVYAKDAAKFNEDFSKAFQKLEELGTKNLVETEWA